MSIELSAPLVGPQCDCSDLDGFMLNVERLISSELLALHGNEIVGAALLLWCRAWKQRPAASLPDDDRVNAAFARLSLAKFRQVKASVTRGFIKCNDGRLYHRVLAKEATKAFRKKLEFQQRRASDAKRLKDWRDLKRETHFEALSVADGNVAETANETHFVAGGNGKDRDRDRDRDIIKELPSAVPKNTKKGTRLPLDWRPNERDWSEACRSLDRHRAENELAKFRDYWPARPDKNAVKLDWDATWRNWVRRAAENPLTSAGQSPAANGASREPTIDMGGEFRAVPERNLPNVVQRFEENGF